MARDYYVILGVDREATQEEIRDAYRRQAMALHPDLSGYGSGPFLEVQEAYSALGDPRSRRNYDLALSGRVRVTVVPDQAPPSVPAEPLGSSRGHAEPLIPDRGPDIRVTDSFDTYRPSRDEVVERMWDSGPGTGAAKSGRVAQLHLDVPIAPEEARRGGWVRLRVPGRMQCPVCGGSGGVRFLECWRCTGIGEVRGEFPVEVPFPAGLAGDHALVIPLDRLGRRDLSLTVHLRCTSDRETGWHTSR